MSESLAKTLTQTRVFCGLEPQELRPFVDRFVSLEFDSKQVAIEEKQVNESLFVVERGEFRVLLPEGLADRAGRRLSEVELSRLTPGMCFGEFSLFDGEPAGATVVATEPSEVIKISKGDFMEVLDSNDQIAKRIYRNIIQLLIDKIRRSDRECDLLLAVD